MLSAAPGLGTGAASFVNTAELPHCFVIPNEVIVRDLGRRRREGTPQWCPSLTVIVQNPVNFGGSFSSQFFVIFKHSCPHNTLGN